MRRALIHRLRDRGAAVESISHTEKVVAFCRVLLAATILALTVVDPSDPSWPTVAYAVIGGYVGFALALFFLVRGEYVRGRRVGPYSVVADIVWMIPITLLTEGGATPFFLLNLFVISSVSLRWGFAASAPLTLGLAALYPILIVVASRWVAPDVFTFAKGHLFRPLYLVALGYLIGYLGEHERRSKIRLGFMLDLMTSLRRDQPSTLSLTRLMRRVLEYCDAPHGLLALRDPESERYFLWNLDRSRGRPRLTLRLVEKNPCMQSFVPESEGFLINTVQPGAGTALCYDAVTGALRRRAVPPDFRLPIDIEGRAILVVPVLVQREWRGCVVIARDRRPKWTRLDLEYLLLLVGQAAATLEAARLRAKAEEVAVLEERARIARDLHDGFIQSLAGIDLRVEACRRMLERDPRRIPGELADLHQAVDRGYRDVRHYLGLLRSASRQTQDLSATLDRLAAEFAIRDHLQVQLALPATDPGLPSATAYELAQIVREALRNAVRHGHATEALVKLAAYGSHCSLVVRDNGRGFTNGHAAVGPDGVVPPTAVPWSIRERAAALGGSLSVRSQPGQGAEIVLRIPLAVAATNGGAHAGRSA